MMQRILLGGKNFDEEWFEEKKLFSLFEYPTLSLKETVFTKK